MDPVNGLTLLAELLRRKLAESSTQGAEKKTRVSGEAPSASAPPAGRAPLEELERQLRAKFRELAPEAKRSREVRHWIIESLLAWEYDGRMRNEPKFSALVQNVQRSIDEDPRLRARFDETLEHLSR